MSQDRYRVVVREWRNGLPFHWYAESTGQRLGGGFPGWRRQTHRTPQGLWEGKDARAIAAAARRKPWGLDARVVKDEAAVMEPAPHEPKGEAA